MVSSLVADERSAHALRGCCRTRKAPRPSVFPAAAVILYDDVAAGHRALRLLVEVTGRLCEDVEFRPQLWRLALLKHAEFRAAIAADLATANIVLLATNGRHFEPALVDYIIDCIDRRHPDSVAVIGLSGASNGATRSEGNPLDHLRRRVTDNGFTFFETTHARLARRT